MVAELSIIGNCNTYVILPVVLSLSVGFKLFYGL